MINKRMRRENFKTESREQLTDLNVGIFSAGTFSYQNRWPYMDTYPACMQVKCIVPTLLEAFLCLGTQCELEKLWHCITQRG